MLSFNELQSLAFTLFNALVPLYGQALVAGRLWGTADNFTRFGNITLNDEMLYNLVRNLSVGVIPSCGVMVIRHSVFVSCAMKLKCYHSHRRASIFM